jgi:hypothetical protein
MTLDDVPDHHEAFLIRAREVIQREVEKSQKARDAAKGETATIQAENATLRAALSQLQSQTEAAKKQLDGVLGDLRRHTYRLIL